jgi:endonuclease I
VLLVGAAGARSDPPPGYYNAAEGKTGAELRQALHQVIRNHNVIPYSSGTRFDTSDALKALDQDPANTNNVIGIYSRQSEPAASFGLTTGWNREHLWCDSYGLDGREPAYSDLNNLRAEDANVNSSRGNKFFDISDTNSAGYRKPAHAEAPLTSTDTDSWEPPASVKGDIARALFYMAVRYMGDTSSEPALYLTDATVQITSTTNFMGRLSTLLRWSQADPVDAAEMLRNDRVYSYQTNRNPFVDRPGWVAAAFIPALSIARASNAIALTWTNEAPAMSAEQSTGLASAWTAVTNAPALTASNTWAIALPPEPGTRFFRLRLQ